MLRAVGHKVVLSVECAAQCAELRVHSWVFTAEKGILYSGDSRAFVS